MQLEFQVWGSREWYEQAVPLLEEHGFHELAALRWADPETDGERMGVYYDVPAGTDVKVDDFLALMARLRDLLKDAEEPLDSIALVNRPTG